MFARLPLGTHFFLFMRLSQSLESGEKLSSFWIENHNHSRAQFQVVGLGKPEAAEGPAAALGR